MVKSYFYLFSLILFFLFFFLGGNLTKLKGNGSLSGSSFCEEKDLLRMMIFVLKEVEKLHNANILHRDLKCDNILFTEQNNKLFFLLIDFGSSFDVESQLEKKKIETITPGYSPPEQNTEKESFGSKNFEEFFLFLLIDLKKNF